MSENAQNKPNKPKVSVIIPFFNREEFLAAAVDSVLAQTETNWELILIDDGSTDSSHAIAEQFIEKHPQKIFMYRHEGGKNRGASSSRNLGIEYASGDFITFLDSDDVFLPETLEIELQAFAANPQADVVCGTLQYWFSWTHQAGKKERDFFVNLGVQTKKLYQPPDLLVHNLRAGGRKPGIGCVILRSEFAKKFKMFGDDFRYVSEDQLFWAKVSLYAKIYIVDACLAKYRQHNLSSSKVLLKSGKAAADWKQFLDWLENYLTENKIDNADVWQGLKSCRRENKYKDRYKFFLNSYRRFLPYHLRYRIRDFIIGWRTRKKDY